MTPPFIPENAPFSVEQRAWLNGFLAGLFSGAPANEAAPATKGESLKLSVLFASQGGTAERLAKKLTKELKGKGHAVTINSLETASPVALAEQENALILASTYGEGEPPESARLFADQLFSPDAPRLDKLRFAVFALGDRNYEHFCKFGADIDERLQTLGATQIVPRVDGEGDIEEPFEQWKNDLFARLPQSGTGKKQEEPLASKSLGVAGISVPASRAVQTYTRDNPYLAVLKDRQALTAGHSSKLTMHLAFALEDPAFTYEAGDACGIVPTNDPALIAEILTLSGLDAEAPIELARAGTLSIEQALLHHLQPTRLTRKIVQAFAAKAEVKALSTLLLPEQAIHLEQFMHDRGLVDLLHAYPGVITRAAELAAMLPRLAPRLYSISSSPAAHAGEVHATIAVVRYRSHDRERGGICSTMLAERTTPSARLPIYIQPNARFRLPADAATPMIMIGPGTGIAPFRAFLHERRALAQPGKNWLFFGERSAETDFLYCQELRAMVQDGHLTRLDTAFSRDQDRKITCKTECSSMVRSSGSGSVMAHRCLSAATPRVWRKMWMPLYILSSQSMVAWVQIGPRNMSCSCRMSVATTGTFTKSC